MRVFIPPSHMTFNQGDSSPGDLCMPLPINHMASCDPQLGWSHGPNHMSSHDFQPAWHLPQMVLASCDLSITANQPRNHTRPYKSRRELKQDTSREVLLMMLLSLVMKHLEVKQQVLRINHHHHHRSLFPQNSCFWLHPISASTVWNFGLDLSISSPLGLDSSGSIPTLDLPWLAFHAASFLTHNTEPQTYESLCYSQF